MIPLILFLIPLILFRRETKLLSLIKQDSQRTQKEYALQLQVSLPTVKRLLAQLQKEKIVVREGNNRKGKWIIRK